MPRARLIRDPIYGYIGLSEELAPVVDHPLFQRLRRIGQTSLTSTVYPSATGSRFEHGLGAAHLAARGWRAAWRRSDVRDDFLGEVTRAHPEVPSHPTAFGEAIEKAVACVALLHDVGHPPFSHILEPLYQELMRETLHDDPRGGETGAPFVRGPFHEVAGVHLARTLSSRLPHPIDKLTQEIYEADPDLETWAGALHSIVAGEIDVDRLDYLMRDGQKAGTEFGAIDFERLIDSLELHRTEHGYKIAPGVRARSAVETLLVQRTQSYKWITFHPRVVGANLALVGALERFLNVGQDVANFQEQTVTLRDRARPLRDLFGPLQPNLNYLWPARSELALAIRGMPQDVREEAEDAHDIVRQLVIEDREQAMIVDEVRAELQAGVDDASVSESLKRAALVARVLLNEPATVQMSRTARAELTRLVTYVHAALFRAKNFIPIWKTIEEYSSMVDLLVDPHGLPPLVKEVFAEVAGDATPGAAGWLAAERDRLLATIEADPVVAVNHIVRAVLSDGERRDKLRRQLDAARSRFLNHGGFWELGYTSFQPVRTANHLTVLFRGDKQRSLLETSPMAQALQQVEAARAKLFAFFFIEYPHDYANFEAKQVRNEREVFANTFISTFADFLRSVWPGLLIDSIERRS